MTEELLVKNLRSDCPKIVLEAKHAGKRWIMVGRLRGEAAIKTEATSPILAARLFRQAYQRLEAAGLLKGPDESTHPTGA